MLIDAHSRRFSYLRLSLTELCNFRCNYCLPDGNDCTSREGEISLPEIRRLVTAFAQLGTRKVRITGGEPSIRKDLTDVIAACKQTPGIEKVALTSNGYRISDKLPEWRAAGLDAINISIDSLDPEGFRLITGRDELKDALDAVEHACNLGIPQVKINTVLLKQHNADNISRFIEFVRERPVSLRFIELMRTSDNADFYREQHLSGQQIQQQLEADGWSLTPRKDTDGPAFEYSHPDYCGKVGLIMPYSPDFCTSCNRLRVSSQCKLFLCLFAEAHQDLRDLLQQDDPEPLIDFLQQAVLGKAATHKLHENQSGATRHLAMIGG